MGCLFLYNIRCKQWCGFYDYTVVRFAAMDYGFQAMGIYMPHDCPSSLPPNRADMRLQSYVFYSRTASGRGNLLSKKSSIGGKTSRTLRSSCLPDIIGNVCFCAFHAPEVTARVFRCAVYHNFCRMV